MPGPSGLGQNAETRTPLRESATPAWVGGRLPDLPSAKAATGGWRSSQEGVKLACSSFAPAGTGHTLSDASHEPGIQRGKFVFHMLL